FEQALELADGALLLRTDDVERFEVRVDVDAEPGPRLRLEFRRHVGRRPGQVADMAPRRLDDVAGAQVAGQFARLGGRLHDHESPAATVAAAGAVLLFRVSQLPLRSIPDWSPCETTCRKNDRSASKIPVKFRYATIPPPCGT